MTVKSIVIHEIIKEAQATGSEVYLTNELLDILNPRILKIVTSIDASFVKKSIKRAKFSNGGFKDEIEDFSKFDLLDVSKELTKKLKDNIQNISSAKGGYLVFTEFTYNNSFLGVFLVRNTDGTKLIQKGSSWDIDSTQYLNVEHFAMGAKINLTILNNNSSDDRYISLVKGNTDIAGYFEKWIGIDDTKQENKDAQALYDLTNYIDLPEGMTSRDELKKKIFDYAKSQSSNIIDLNTLSTYIYGNADYIQNYCNDKNIDIDSEFKLKGANLNKFIKASVKADDIEITAPRSIFSSDKIKLINGKVVIDSPSLISQIETIKKLNKNE